MAAVAAVMMLGTPAVAGTCFLGNASSGTLEFSGAVEGSGFTGAFGEFEVRYCMTDGAPAEGEIEVVVSLASADSENRERDQTLLGPEFFAVDRFPDARWVSETIEPVDDGYRAAGKLTLRDITAEQSIGFRVTPDGDALLAEGAFTMGGSAEVDRLRFDVGTGEFADPEFVRNRVDVRFEVRLTAAED